MDADERGFLFKPGALPTAALLTPDENDTRVRSFDLARGVGALGMVAVHILLLYGSRAANVSLYGAAIRFLGGPLAAPVFLFLMGASLPFSRRGSPRAVLRRAVALLLLAYALNFLRGTLPAFLGLRFGVISPRDLMSHTPADLFWVVDVLHCAALSLVLIAAVRFLLPWPWAWLLLAAAVALGSPLLWGRMSGSPVLDRGLELLWGTGDMVQFPLLPWLSYPLTGLAFGTWLVAGADRDGLFRRAAGMGLALLLTSGWLILIRPAVHFGDYFRSGPGAVMAFTGLVLVWLAACQWLVNCVWPNALFRLFYRWSERITPFFVVHWILLGWGIGLFGHTRLSVLALLLLSIMVLVLTDRLVWLWERGTAGCAWGAAPVPPDRTSARTSTGHRRPGCTCRWF